MAVCLTATRGRGRFLFRAVQHLGQLLLGFLHGDVFLSPQHPVAPGVQAVMTAPVAQEQFQPGLLIPCSVPCCWQPGCPQTSLR